MNQPSKKKYGRTLLRKLLRSLKKNEMLLGRVEVVDPEEEAVDELSVEVEALERGVAVKGEELV